MYWARYHLRSFQRPLPISFSTSSYTFSHRQHITTSLITPPFQTESPISRLHLLILKLVPIWSFTVGFPDESGSRAPIQRLAAPLRGAGDPLLLTLHNQSGPDAEAPTYPLGSADPRH